MTPDGCSPASGRISRSGSRGSKPRWRWPLLVAGPHAGVAGRLLVAALVIGIVIVVIGGAALLGATAAAFAATRGFGHFTDAVGPGDRAAGLRGQGGGRDLRDRAARRLDHRRVRGLAVHRLRDQRRVRHQPLAAPGRPWRQGVLRDLRDPDRGGGPGRTHPWIPAWPADRGRAGPGGCTAPVRERVPAAAAVQ